MNELEALLFLTHIPYLGSIKIRLLIQHFGSAQAAVQAKASDLAALPGFGPKILSAWALDHGWERTRDSADKEGVQILSFKDPSYPKRLHDLIDLPIILYVKGQLTSVDQRSLAVIGTRQASIYGLETAKKMSDELAAAGFTVISGLARGIDTAAHLAALEKGRTIAVLGSGFHHLYPKENARLADKIIENGALISEFPLSVPPDRQNFPQRNRIVSGMTLGTVLIEAPLHSGAMITADQAFHLKRPVFAIPGRVDQENFQGNHELIKNRRAQLIENSKDVILYYSDLFASLPNKPSIQNRIQLEKEEEEFIQLLPSEELSIENIVTRTKLSITKVNVLLMGLLLKKMIKEYPGKIYKKVD